MTAKETKIDHYRNWSFQPSFRDFGLLFRSTQNPKFGVDVLLGRKVEDLDSIVGSDGDLVSFVGHHRSSFELV